jgi:hypothetical protein
MTHLADRRGKVLCGASEGIPYAFWRFKSDGCSKCGRIFRARKHQFIISQIEDKATKMQAIGEV